MANDYWPMSGVSDAMNQITAWDPQGCLRTQAQRGPNPRVWLDVACHPATCASHSGTKSVAMINEILDFSIMNSKEGNQVLSEVPVRC